MADQTHLLGLLLGTEEDWPSAFEPLVRRLDPALQAGGGTHRYDVERITIEPFDLRQPAALLASWSTASRTGTTCRGSG